MSGALRRNSFKWRLLAGAALAAPCALAAPAHAQTASTSAENAARSDEIIVQARKRDESIQDVPASVSSFSEERSELLNLEDVDDYVRQTPGAILIASGPSYLDDIAIRGQGGGRLGFSESTTGIYREGIYVAGGGFGGRTFSRIDFFDLANVEVYRGPQGALYGRNAVGGAVNVISRKPSQEFEARVKADYNSVERYDVEGVVNAPIIADKLSLRLGGYYTAQDDGFYHLEGREEALDSINEEWGIRGSASLSIGPWTDLLVIGERSHSKTLGFTSQGQNLTVDPEPFVRIGLGDFDSVIIDQTSVIAKLEHEMEWADFVLVGNYKTRDGDRPDGDFDHFLGFNNAALRIVDEQFEDFERYGLEARLASKGEGPFTWLFGGDYQHYVSHGLTDRFGTVAGPFAFSAALRSQLRTDKSTEELSSFSVFGLIGYDFTERLNVSLEARVQQDSKDFIFERVDGDPLTNETIPLTTFDAKWTRVLPTLSVKYAASDAVTLYARAATGYRPGGFNPSPTPGFFDQTEYGPELAKSFEAGVKADFDIAGVRVQPQLSGYYTITDDIQQTTNLSTSNNVFSLQNVGDASIFGAEFELVATAKVAGGDLYSNLGVSTTDGYFHDGTEILFQGVTFDLSKGRVPRTRDYILNYNLAYDVPVTNALNAFISWSVQAEGGGYDNVVGFLKIPGFSRSNEHYEIIDITGGVRGDRWRLSGYVKNLGNEIYELVVVNNNRFVNDPRTYGATLTVRF